MARKLKKSIDVQKFGGIDELGKVKGDMHAGFDGHHQSYDASSVEAASDTKLEDDKGSGKAVVMRSFTFKLDRKVFEAVPPTKQELFDGHVHGLEMALWRDGLIFDKSHEPHIVFNKKLTHYTIFLVANPARGQTVLEKPQTLTEIAHG